MPLLRVQAFINTLDLEQETDVLLDPATGGAWLVDAGLVGAGMGVSAQELETARAVRAGLRALVRRNGGGPGPNADELGALQRLAQSTRPVVGIDPSGRISIAAGEVPGLSEGLLGLLLVVRDAQADGSWARLKLCANPDCSWVFYDRSRNRQGTWCTMAVCGNRLKNRRFRARAHPR